MAGQHAPPASQPLHVGSSQRWSRVLTWERMYIAFLHIFAITLAILYWDSTQAPSCHGTAPTPIAAGQTWSPAREYVQYELGQANMREDRNPGPDSKFWGPPNPERDEAWEHLTRPMFFRANLDELIRAEESLENLAELKEGGHFAALGVYHELHCLQKIRYYLYPAYYYPNMTEAEGAELRHHLDHCVEVLRLSAMCHGNTGLYTFAWSGEDLNERVTKSNARSQCVKWSSIENWSRSRMVSTHPAVRRPSRSGVSAGHR